MQILSFKFSTKCFAFLQVCWDIDKLKHIMCSYCFWEDTFISTVFSWLCVILLMWATECSCIYKNTSSTSLCWISLALCLYIWASLSSAHLSLRKAIDWDYSMLNALMLQHTAVSCRTSLSFPHKDILINSTVLRDYLPAGFTFHPIKQTHCFLCEEARGALVQK